MNGYFTQQIADRRHAEFVVAAEQSRRYHAARAVRTGTVRRPTPRIGAVRRPFRAVQAWLVAGVQ